MYCDRFRVLGEFRNSYGRVYSRGQVVSMLRRGVIPFTKPTVQKQGYYTNLLGIFHIGQVYAPTINNYNKGLNRILNCLQADPIIDAQLRDNQIHGYHLGARTQRRWRGEQWRFLDHLQDTFAQVIQHREMYDAIDEFVKLPHPKQKLRMATHKDNQESGAYDGNNLVPSVTVKMKTMEFAGYKKPRMIVDLGAPSSFYAYNIDAMKYAFEQDYIIDNKFRMRYVKKADLEEIRTSFTRLLSGDYNLEVVYHSDDSTCGIVTTEGLIHINVDISECDASQGVSVADRVLKITEIDQNQYNLYKMMVSQCEAPMTLSNPEGPKENVKILYESFKEYSGSGLTVVLNNVASSHIWLRVHYELSRRPSVTPAEAKDLVIQCALSMGYKVKAEICCGIPAIQFLKYSPDTIIHGEPFLALGTLLRSLTRYDGDVPGRKSTPLHVRIENQIRSVLEGHQHSGGHIITDALCARFGLPKFTRRVSNTTLCVRYQLDIHQLTELAGQLSSLKIGEVIRSATIDRIMFLDYSYEFPVP